MSNEFIHITEHEVEAGRRILKLVTDLYFYSLNVYLGIELVRDDNIVKCSQLIVAFDILRHMIRIM